jgi:hypothetical protein
MVALEELGVRIDRRKRVTHIVGYRARHPANCRHPLSLYPLAWCTPLHLVSPIRTKTLSNMRILPRSDISGCLRCVLTVPLASPVLVARGNLPRS